MTALNKQALREHYSPKPVPKCHICGAEMTIQRMSVLRTTYGCTGATYDDKGCHYAEGRSIADDHYAQSHVTVVDLSDPEVLAVLDELEAAEKRIAELEARAFNPAILDVVAERQRQRSAEGWTPEHDDQYGKSQLLWASSCYLLNTIQPFNRIPMDWPWDSSWWDGECWKSFDCHNVVPGKVTHWMPLPAAPQQEVNP